MSIDKVTKEDSKHLGDVTSICYHNEHLYSAGNDAKVKIWDKDLTFKKDINIHESHIYCIVVDKNGRLYTSSCDGEVKTVEKPLESSESSVILKHDNEIEVIFLDENLTFYCGDDHGGISVFENLKFKFVMNIVEHVKGLYVEKGQTYTLANLDLSVHEMRGTKYSMRASIPGKFPVTLFGQKENDRSKYIAIGTRDGRGITVVCNNKFNVLDVAENRHGMIINAMKGFGDYLFSCDYAGKVVKSQMVDGKLKEIASVVTDSGCANCIEVVNDKIVYVGSSDGTVKRITFN